MTFDISLAFGGAKAAGQGALRLDYGVCTEALYTVSVTLFRAYLLN